MIKITSFLSKIRMNIYDATKNDILFVNQVMDHISPTLNPIGLDLSYICVMSYISTYK